MRFILALILVLGWLPLKAHAGGLPERTLAMVQDFLKTPAEQLPPKFIPKFMAVDPLSLPKKLRTRFRAKKVELKTMLHLYKMGKRGTVRMPESDCAKPRLVEWEAAPSFYAMARFVPISEDEEDYVMRKTKCTEDDLMCEFSLQVLVVETVQKGRKVKKRHLFLHRLDPLNALVGAYRQGQEGPTQFFGIGGPTCAPRRNASLPAASR